MLTPDAVIERLAISYSWIGKRPERINNLRLLLIEANKAGGESGMHLINSLITRFVFMTADDYENAIMEMAEYVDETFNLSATIICAASADHTKDSGQKVLYDLCSALGALGHRKIHSSNRYDHIQKLKIAATDIVLIDEFIGTGRSFLGRVVAMKKQFIGIGKNIPKLHGIAVAGMSNGLREIAHGFDSLTVFTSLLRGIQGMAPRQSMTEEYDLMSLMENELCANIDGKNLPRLGDGACEALYARSLGNCPNSVLPIFWWPKVSPDLKRSPLFTRVL
jgi:hypothetical protein